ncbi:MAG: tRNA (adenosine(37)-N6)-dimethylallyltransferase MiaA [Pseudomonadota bacterium]
MLKKSVICLMGPTATGKTDAAAALADRFPVELISVDSSLVYRGMDIGTAKPDKEFLNKYPHHLIDIRDPEDTYSVAEFINDAKPLIHSAIDSGRTPVLVGGTMFYFNALEKGLDDLPAANAEIREAIDLRAREQGWPSLHEELKRLDPAAAKRIQANDAQRIQRALEICALSKTAVPKRESQRDTGAELEFIKFGLSFSDRKFLHERIQGRYQQMIENGLIDEIQGLLDSGIDPATTSMRMIGYRQLLEHLSGQISQGEAIEKAVAATRQLAKRQLTWMRNQSNLIWWVDHGLADKRFDGLVDSLSQYLR